MLRETYSLYSREIKKTYRNGAVVFMMVIQPIMWLVFFGSSFSEAPSQFLSGFFHTDNYIAFLLPGELSTSMLFIGMFSSMSMIQDKRFGFLKRILVTSAPKESIFLGKVLGAATRGLIQIPVMMIVAIALGVRVPLDPLGVLGWVVALFLLGVGMASLYTIITLRSADWQTPGVVSNLINLPLMFSSTALFPSSLFPWWMRDIASVNPLSYTAEFGREVILTSDPTWSYLGFVAAFSLVMLLIGFLTSKRWLTAE